MINDPDRPDPIPAKPLLSALTGRRPDAVPFWFMRQAGRYLPEYRKLRQQAGSFLELVHDPEKAAEVTLQPLRRFAPDAAILFSDILVIPAALGQRLEFVEGEGPKLDPIESAADLARLSDDCADRLDPIFETVHRVAERLDDQTALIGFAGAPWTVACYMVAGGSSPDQAPARMFAYRDPEGFGRLIDRLVAVTGDYLLKQIRAGAEVIQIFDSWSGSLAPGEFSRWCIEPTRRLVAKLKSEVPGVPVIGFPRGAGPSVETFAEQTGVAAVGLDTAMPNRWAEAALDRRICIQGNLDPLLVVAGGRAMEDAAIEILKVHRGRPHIFNLGHGIVPQTPPEHVKALADLIRQWRPEE